MRMTLREGAVYALQTNQVTVGSPPSGGNQLRPHPIEMSPSRVDHPSAYKSPMGAPHLKGNIIS